MPVFDSSATVQRRIGSAVGAFVFRGDNSGATDVTAALQAACDANAVVLLPPGTYRCGLITSTGKNLTIRAAGPVKIVQTNATGVIDFRGGWDLLGAVTALGTVRTNLVDAGESAPTTSDTWVTELTMAAATAVTKADVIKVYSADINTYARPSSNNRLGEYSLAGKTSSGTAVTLTNVLVEPYATTIRAARLQSWSLVVEGPIAFDTDPAIRDVTVFGAVISIRSAKNCRVEGVSFLNSVGRAIGNTGYQTVIRRCTFRNLANRPSKSQYGYGLQDGGWGSRMIDCHGENLRHLYSEGAGTPSSGTDDVNVDYYGGGWYGNVNDCSGTGCQGQPFDTHGTAYGTTFSDCRAVGTFIGASSGGSGFAVRGRNITLADCVADGCMVGFAVSATNSRVVNCTARRTYYQALQLRGDTDDSTLITTVDGIVVEGGLYENIAGNVAVAIGTAGFTVNARLERVTARMLAGANPSRGFDMANGPSTTRMVDCVVDFTQFATATNVIGINVSTNNAVVRSQRLRFLGGSAPFTSATLCVSNGASNGDAADVSLTGCEYEHASVNPSTVSAALTKTRYSGVIKFGTSWFNTLRSNTFAITAAASASLAAIARAADLDLNVRFTGSAGDVTVGTLPGFANGVTPGTRLTLINNNSGIVTIPTGSGLSPNVALAIPVNGAVVLTSFGDAWRVSNVIGSLT